MSIGDTRYAISEAGLMLTASMTEDTPKVYPAENISPELAAAIGEHKVENVRILREDEKIRLSGIIKSEHRVFELARRLRRERCWGGRDAWHSWMSAAS